MSIKLRNIVRGIVTVVLCAALGAAAPAQAAMNRRAPINWGGGGAQSARSSGPHYHQWRPLWRYVWSAAKRNYNMHPARSVARSPNCPANLRIGPIVERTIDATARHRYGDTVNALGRFQARLLCLSPDGAHGVDFALSAFNALAVRDLRGRELDQAVTGSFNLGLLAFDAIQYSGRSWWLPVMYHDYYTERFLIAHYPGQNLGLWLYDVESGSLRQVKFGGRDWRIYTGLMHAFAHPGVFDRGECSLLGMAAMGFSCGRGGADRRSMGSGTGSGGAGGLGMGGGSGGATSCMISAALHTGSLGSLSCMARAGGLGGFHMPATAAAHVQVRGVIDSQCAMNGGANDDNGKSGSPKSGSKHADAKNSHWYDGLVNGAKNFWKGLHFAGGGSSGGGSSSASSGHSKPPPEPQPGSFGYAQQMAARKAYFDKERAKLKKHGLKKFHKGGGHAVNGGLTSGGGCGGHGTNAAAQVAAMFACTGTGSTRGGMSASGPRFPGAGGGGSFSMPGPGGGSGAPGGLMSCAMQGGGLVRSSRNDKRCQQSYCARGARCSCNGGGSRGGVSPIGAAGHRAVTAPTNTNGGVTDYGRNHVGNTGGFTGPKLPTFGGGPSKQ